MVKVKLIIAKVFFIDELVEWELFQKLAKMWLEVIIELLEQRVTQK